MSFKRFMMGNSSSILELFIFVLLIILWFSDRKYRYYSKSPEILIYIFIFLIIIIAWYSYVHYLTTRQSRKPYMVLNIFLFQISLHLSSLASDIAPKSSWRMINVLASSLLRTWYGSLRTEGFTGFTGQPDLLIDFLLH